MSMKEITVVLADDTEVAVEGIKAILATTQDISVVGETNSVYSVPRLVQELSPEVLVMDLKWHGDQSVGWIKIREIKAANPALKVIAITAFENLTNDAWKAGADLVLTKHFTREGLIQAIKQVVDQEIVPPAPPSIPSEQHPDDQLSPRELEVLTLLVKGLANKEIAQALAITLNTTKNHVKSILQKLEVDSRFKAVVRAKELRILLDE